MYFLPPMKLVQSSHSIIFQQYCYHRNISSDPVPGPSPGVRNSFECDESDDDLRREEGINFAGDSGPLGASGRSISLDPGALGKK